jgi:hypothetical protein
MIATVSIASAQEVRASLTGTVTDSQGAAIPGVTITATNVANNVSITQVTNDAGLYITPFLAPGTYRLTAEKQGFRRYVHDGIVLQVQDRPRLTSCSRSAKPGAERHRQCRGFPAPGNRVALAGDRQRTISQVPTQGRNYFRSPSRARRIKPGLATCVRSILRVRPTGR